MARYFRNTPHILRFIEFMDVGNHNGWNLERVVPKKEELVFTRDHDEPIGLGKSDPALLLLQRIRDEAHRFAVTFHRTARARRTITSELDAIPGVGARTRNALLRRFGSLAGVRRATREELASEIGAKRADAILRFFAAASH